MNIKLEPIKRSIVDFIFPIKENRFKSIHIYKNYLRKKARMNRIKEKFSKIAKCFNTIPLVYKAVCPVLRGRLRRSIEIWIMILLNI